MNEVLAAIAGAIVSGILGMWITPIWRDARRIGAQEAALPNYCTTNSLSRLIFRFFQWIYWGEAPIVKRLITLLEERIDRPKGTESGMILKARGAVYQFEPMPATRSLYDKLPYVFGALFGIFILWGVVVMPLLGLLISKEAMVDATFVMIWVVLGAMFFLTIVAGIVSWSQPARMTPSVAVIFHDEDIVIWPLTSKPLSVPPVFRISPSFEKNRSSWNVFRPITLFDVSIDGGEHWDSSYGTSLLIYQISQMWEREKDWQTHFRAFCQLIAAEADRWLGERVPESR
jgi:MFS family permease